MIITRSPLRISLGGGGTDLPSYYRQHSGFLIAAAIDKYVYINVHRRFVEGFLLKYSSLEEAATVDDIKHPIIREALKRADGNKSQAARLLGITRNALRYRLSQMGLE